MIYIGSRTSRITTSIPTFTTTFCRRLPAITSSALLSWLGRREQPSWCYGRVSLSWLSGRSWKESSSPSSLCSVIWLVFLVLLTKNQPDLNLRPVLEGVLRERALFLKCIYPFSTWTDEKRMILAREVKEKHVLYWKSRVMCMYVCMYIYTYIHTYIYDSTLPV